MPYTFCEQTGKEVRDISDEIPFDIPDSWEWVRLGCISTYNEKKQKINAKDADSSIWGLDLEDIEKGGKLLEKKTVGERKAVGDKTVFSKGDILYSKLRPYLLKILIAHENGICTPEIVPFTVYGNISAEYIVNYLKSPYVDGMVNGETYGIKMPRAGTETMVSLLVPVPPLSEQHRIVSKIEELIPYIERYGDAETKLNELNTTFPEALKKSILQEAVQGKLVPQNPGDEPASVLLERIRAEKKKLVKEGKIKKDKSESVIVTRDKIPYEIPDSWVWCTLGSIINLVSGQDFEASDYNTANKGIPYLTGASNIENETTILNRWTETPRCIANKGDLLVVCKGAGVGKMCILGQEQVHIARQIMSIQPIFINIKYIKAFLEHNLLSLRKSMQGVIPGISRDIILSMPIPLPPLAEQYRIVAKIEEIMPYINEISL